MLAAVERRGTLARDPTTTAYRLLHGAADSVPGVAVDRLGPVCSVHLYAQHQPVRPLALALREVLGDVSVYVKRHPPRAGRLDPDTLARLAPGTPVVGPPRTPVDVREYGALLRVRLDEGLSTGLFLDMREVRQWVRAHAAGRTVLNLFAYTCAFGVVASLGGATRVLNLDLSRPYLAWGRESYALNDLPAPERDFVYGDAFDWLRRWARRGEQFDLVIVDPPSFSRSRAGAFSVERDYAALAVAAALVVAPGGVLLAATNHAGVSPAAFDTALGDGMARAGRRAAPLRRWHEPAADFPTPPGERPYLKVRALRVQ